MIRAVLMSMVLGALVLPMTALAQEGDQSSDAAKELQALQQEYSKEMASFMQEYNAAETAEAKSALLNSSYPAPAYAEKFAEFAEKHPKTDAAMTALLFVMQNSRDAEAQAKALETVKSDHMESKGIANVISSWMYDPSKEGLIREILQVNPHREAKGVALYVLAKQKMRGAGGDEAVQAEATAMLQQAAEEYGDVPMRGRTLKEVAAGDLFEATRLQIGMEAPDITGDDIDGVEFKLSDYRGKVVVLDFWGHW